MYQHGLAKIRKEFMYFDNTVAQKVVVEYQIKGPGGCFIKLFVKLRMTLRTTCI